MKKVLIVTYYWPPSGGSGVQRWLKFAKYLPEYGWEPIIITPENPSFINQDDSLIEETENMEVLKLPIWEPYHLIQKLTGKKVHQKDVVLTGKLTFTQKLAAWIRGNFFIPDPRKFWVRPVYKFLHFYLKETEIDTIITTGPPHSLHQIGLKLKRKHGIKWIADFRDPWSEWDVLETFRLTKLAERKHSRMERKVLNKADHVISVGWHMDMDFKRLGARNSHVITNGFDPDDFTSDKKPQPKDEFVIRHIGSIDDQRDPRPFIDLLAKLNLDQSKKIVLEFVGNVNPSLVNHIKNSGELNEMVRFSDYVPHSEAILLYQETDLLLLVLAHSKSAKLNITGKIFEYIASGTPVLGIGDPEGDASRVLSESEGGVVFNPDNLDGISDYILNQIDRPGVKTMDLHNSPFSRKILTEKLVNILEL